jgi:hypothetical protein
MTNPTHDGRQSVVALWASVAVMLVGSLAGIILWGAAFLADFSDFRHMLLHEHFTVMVGLPSSAAGAFIVVSLFRQTEGPITIKGLGFELQGAAGPVLLWVLCFLAICGGIKLLW